jgi:hypothetical protein
VNGAALVPRLLADRPALTPAPGCSTVTAVAARNLTPRPLTVEELPPAMAAFIRTQAELRGLDRDPLPETTHGLRSDEETLGPRPGGRGLQTERHTVEMLLTPELLIISYREGGDDGGERIGPTARVSFHRLAELEVATPPAGMQRRTHGSPPAPPKDALTVTSTPLGATRRTTRHVPTGSGPDVTRFREAVLSAQERA